MVATKLELLKKRWKPFTTLAASFVVMVLSFQNCAVEMSPNTPGAASQSCAPSAAVLTEFEPVLNDILQKTGNLTSAPKQGCGNCHGITSGHPGSAVFTIFEGNTTTSPNLILSNYCQVQAAGVDKIMRVLGTSHSGGQYAESEIQSLVDFCEARL